MIIHPYLGDEETEARRALRTPGHEGGRAWFQNHTPPQLSASLQPQCPLEGGTSFAGTCADLLLQLARMGGVG